MKLNQKGFTLIELLVVIGIIGILSVIAIPNFMKFQSKAKQSEAKIVLSGLYTAEKAFFSEWTTYHGGLGNIGYQIEGNKRYYSTGFTAAGTAVPAGVTAVPTRCGNVNDAANSGGFCPMTTPNGGAPLTGTTADTTLATALGGAPCAAANPPLPASFCAGASGRIADANSQNAGVDAWVIDQDRVLANVQQGF